VVLPPTGGPIADAKPLVASVGTVARVGMVASIGTVARVGMVASAGIVAR